MMETERLILRKYKEDDLEDLYEYLSDEEVLAYEPYKPMSKELVKENLNWRIETDEMIAVVEKMTVKMIGNVYLGSRDFERKEIGYVFNKNYWGKGYAREACQVVIQCEFALGTHRIYAECDPNNTASWRLLERLGFAREAHFKQNVYFWKDTFVYSILNGNKLY